MKKLAFLLVVMVFALAWALSFEPMLTRECDVCHEELDTSRKRKRLFRVSNWRTGDEFRV